MKTLWRLTALVLTLCMLLPLAACGNGGLEEHTYEPPVETETQGEIPEPTEPKKTYNMTQHLLSELDGQVRLYGERTHISAEDGLIAEWPCTGFEMTIETEGTNFDVTFNTNYQNFFKIYVDGVEAQSRTQVTSGGGSKTMIRDLEAGTHSIKIIKDSQVSTARNNYCNITSVSFDGTVLPTENTKKELFLEFIGDSIWCGAGALGNQASAPNYNNEVSSTVAVPYLTAQALDADYAITSRGSIGVVAKAGDYNASQLFTMRDGYRGEEKYQHTRVPDAVIICLGTNDSSTGSMDFVRGGQALIRQIRATYGTNVPIIWTHGMMRRAHLETEVHMIVDGMGGEANGVYFLKMTYGTNGSGSGATNRHPGKDDHAQNVEVVVPYLKNVLGMN